MASSTQKLSCQKLTQSMTDPLVVAITARALFDLEKENDIYEKSGLDAYRDYQQKRKSNIRNRYSLSPGIWPLKFNFNSPGKAKKVVSSSYVTTLDLSARVFKSIEKYNLEIDQAVFCSGAPIDPYLRSFGVDLFLSRSETEVRSAIQYPAARLYSPPEGFTPDDEEIQCV